MSEASAMDIFTFIARYFWLLALVMTGVNAAIYRRRLVILTVDHPERVEGYRRYIIGFVAVSGLLWLIMGAGIIFGGLPSVFAYFNPAAGNPFVLAWHATAVVLWVVGLIWLFFRGGAQFIIDHPGILNFNPTRPIHVQLWYLACLAGGVAGEVMMWSGFFPQS
jgi:hypothetical protein